MYRFTTSTYWRPREADQPVEDVQTQTLQVSLKRKHHQCVNKITKINQEMLFSNWCTTHLHHKGYYH